MAWKKCRFNIADTDVTYEGYTDGTVWNGWECPWFTKEEGMKIVAEYIQTKQLASFDEYLDSFIFEMEPEDPELAPDIATGCDIIIDGIVLHLYAIGSCSWIWDIAKEPID